LPRKKHKAPIPLMKTNKLIAMAAFSPAERIFGAEAALEAVIVDTSGGDIPVVEVAGELVGDDTESSLVVGDALSVGKEDPVVVVLT
jgi:hypothetical protein